MKNKENCLNCKKSRVSFLVRKCSCGKTLRLREDECDSCYAKNDGHP